MAERLITIHEAKAADFSTLGLGALTPSECTVRERAGGLYELKLVQPVTEDGRHRRIKPMRIIKAPAPVRETPLVELDQLGSAEREIYRVATVGARLNLRTGPGRNCRIIHAYPPGTEVVKLGEQGDWMRAALPDGGATGWMHKDNLVYVRTETEIIEGDTPGGVIQPRQTREQLFRIYRCSPDTKERAVTAEARHITYDLAGAVVEGEYSPEKIPANVVCANLMAKADHDVSDFHLYCAVSGPVSGEFGGRNILDCLLDPETGIVAQTRARLVRDNYDIFILPDEARNRGVELRYGKNLLSAHMDADVSDLITRIKPVGKAGKGEKLYLTENGGWVESPYIDQYPAVYSKEVEYGVAVSDDLPIDQARALLKEKAEADFAAGCDMASVKLDADFVRLELTEDYRQLASAYALHLYDSVPVIDREAEIAAAARMTGYVYDAILDEYQETVLGGLEEVKSTIYGYELAAGSVSGGKLIPNTVNGDRLQNLSVSYGKFDLAAVRQLSADAIVAIRAEIRELVAGNITADQLYTDLAVIAAAQITAANIEKANIQWAEIENLAAEIAKVVNAEIAKAEIDWAQIKNAEIDAADITNLTAAVATIVKAEIALAEIDGANIKNATIDTAKIKLGAITSALIQQGAIGTAQIADGSITEAKIVSLNADVIKTGTLSADRLLIKGAGGLFYEINAAAGGLTASQLTEEQYKNAISGTALVARSVTADKIAAKSITANEILSGTITAAEIDVESVFAAQAVIAALDNYILRTATIEALKGSLDVWAEEKITLSAGQIRSEVESAVTGLQTQIDQTDEQVLILAGRRYGGRNYLLGTAQPYTAVGTGERIWLYPWRCASSGEVNSLFGKTVTISFEYEAAITGGEFMIYLAGLWRGVEAFGTDKTSGRISRTIALGETSVSDDVFIYIDGAWTGSVTFSHMKVELGDVATDWSPHPEDPAGSVNAGGVVRVDQTGVHMSGGTIEMETSDGEEYIHIKNSGISASSLDAPNVARRYDGPTALYVDSNASGDQIAAGNYFRSLSDALATVNDRMLDYNVFIYMTAGMSDYANTEIKGVYGSGAVLIYGQGATVYGTATIRDSRAQVHIDQLNIAAPSGVSQAACTVQNAGAYVYNSVMSGDQRGFAVENNGYLDARSCKLLVSADQSAYVLRSTASFENCTGNGYILCHRGNVTAYGAVPAGGVQYWESCEPNNVGSLSPTGGSGTPAAPVISTAVFNYLHSDSYARGWSAFEDDDIRQGYNGQRIFGVIWFDAAAIQSALSGKTVKQASLRLHMQKGYGRGTDVSVQMYGSNISYDRTDSPELITSYGTIGSTAPGEINEITIPVQAVTDLAGGAIQALVLYSDDTEYYKGRGYSKNYARFSGSASADIDTCPRLTVIYQ